MFCPKCGFQYDDEETVFCPGCGVNLMEFAQEAVAQETSLPDSQTAVPSQETVPMQYTDASVTGEAEPEIQAAPAAAVPEEPVSQAAAPAATAVQPKKKWKPGGNPVVLILGAVLGLLVLVSFVAILIVLLAGGGRSQRIYLNDYVNITFDGYDGGGEAKAEFDEDHFKSEYAGKIKISSKGRRLLENGGEQSAVTSLLSTVFSDEDADATAFFPLLFEKGTLSPKSGLANGDTVTFEWNLSEEDINIIREVLKCSVVAENISRTAEGLEETPPVDLFEGLTLLFTGGEPNGRAEIDTPATYEYADELEYTIDPYDGLSNGDEVTVTVSAYGQDIDTYLSEQYGVRAKETEKKFTVEGLDTFAREYDDVTDETLRRMDQKARGMLDAYFSNNSESLRDPQITSAGTLFLQTNDEDDVTDAYNMAVMLYHIEVLVSQTEDGYEYTGTAEYDTCVTFRDITVDEYGASDVDLDTGELTSVSFFYEIPDTWNGVDCLGYDLRGWKSADELVDEVYDEFGDRYSIEEHLETVTGGTQNTDDDTDQDDATQGTAQDDGGTVDPDGNETYGDDPETYENGDIDDGDSSNV